MDEDFDRFVEFEGNRQQGGHTGERYGISYLSNNSGEGQIKYMPEVITGGKYKVYAWYPSDKKILNMFLLR